MTVYVDDMHRLPMGQFRRMKMSHMIADTETELHAMADAIGVSRRWCQRVPSGIHYDICLSKRALAVRHGAHEITLRQLAAMAWCARTQGEFGDPETAEARMLAGKGAREA